MSSRLSFPLDDGVRREQERVAAENKKFHEAARKLELTLIPLAIAVLAIVGWNNKDQIASALNLNGENKPPVTAPHPEFIPDKGLDSPTPTNTKTLTPTRTPTDTKLPPTPTPTFTETITATPTDTETPTSTPTRTPRPTLASKPTRVAPQPTITPQDTETPTPTVGFTIPNGSVPSLEDLGKCAQFSPNKQELFGDYIWGGEIASVDESGINFVSSVRLNVGQINSVNVVEMLNGNKDSRTVVELPYSGNQVLGVLTPGAYVAFGRDGGQLHIYCTSY